MRGASYVPGDWCLVVADRGFAALQADVPSDLVTRIWERLGRDNGLSPVLEALTGAFGTSLSAIPPFAVGLTEGDALRVAVRGDIAVEVTAATGSDTVTGAGVTTWSERVIADARTIDVTFPGGQATDASYPIADGIVFASRLRVVVTAAAPVAPTPVGVPAPVTQPPVAEPVEASIPPAPVAPTPVAPTRVTQPPVSEPVEASNPPALIDHTPVAPAFGPATPGPVTAPLIDSADVQAAADGDTLLPVESTLGPESVPVSEYDHLWGATIARPIEEAAVRPEESEPALHTEAPPTPPAPPTPAAPAAGDHDGATISVAQARALRGATTDPPAVEPPVTALLKAVPSVGRIRLSTGEVVALDRTVVIGRRPRATRVSGTHLPHLIAVDSPQQDISRSHVEIRPEGDSVLVIDLHTTNGTTLLRVGKEPVRLHPGEQTVVVTGDVIDLGDGLTVAFEDLP